MTMGQVNMHLDKGCSEGTTSAPSSSPLGDRKRSISETWVPQSSPGEKVSKNPLFQARKPSEVSIQSTLKRTGEYEQNSSVKKTKPAAVNNRDKNKPLAELIRPRSLDEYIGQSDLVGPGGILRGFIERDTCPSIILWGPCGVGKTTIARIIAKHTKSRFVEFSATTSGINDCKKLFEEAKNEYALTGRRTILFLDEVHRFNKLQQDVFLPFVERGDITLIGATTENPSFTINGALLSRCRVLVLKKLTPKDVESILSRALKITNELHADTNLPAIEVDSQVIPYLSELADGDGRAALNMFEVMIQVCTKDVQDPDTPITIKKDQVSNILKRTHLFYDRLGDAHYDSISALHKSVRGSDPDAALFYLGRMLQAGEDPLYIARRMVRMASEDIGAADDTCLPFAVSTYQAVQQVGMPEADCILAHCAFKLATAPKSVQIYRAYNKVKSALQNEPGLAAAETPIHLRNAPTRLMKEIGYGKEYKYNPDYKDGKVKQQYMPTGYEELKFLGPGHLGTQVDSDLSD